MLPETLKMLKSGKLKGEIESPRNRLPLTEAALCAGCSLPASGPINQEPITNNGLFTKPGARLKSVLPLEWANQRYSLAAISPISQKIPVGRENDAVTFEFGHSHEACVGKRHRDIVISFQVPQNFSRLVVI